MDSIQAVNQLPVATADDLAAMRQAVLCGEDHPWGCKKYDVVKVTSEQGALVVTAYGWLASDQEMCALVGKVTVAWDA